VKGADGNNYITQTQLMMSTGSGGGGGGTGGGTSHNQVISAVSQVMAEKGVVTSYDIKTINGYSLVGYGDIEVTADGFVDLSAYMTKQEMSAYVSKVELDNASYLNQTYLNDKMSDYPTFSNIQAMGYATQSYVSNSCKSVKDDAYAYAASRVPEIDLSSYVTKAELQTLGYAKIQHLTYAEYSQLSNYDSNTIYNITDDTSFDLGYYVTKDELEKMSYATQSYVTTKCEEVKQASYAYTDSKTKNVMSYGDVDSLVKQIINQMVANGDLVSYNTVKSMIDSERV
jgi:hypothetical protein